MHNAFAARDASLLRTTALPTAAASPATSASIDLKKTAQEHFLAECEIEIVAPALSTTQLPDTDTAIYDVLMSDSANLGTPTVLFPAVITQTGAAGAGAAAATKRVRLPSDVKRYIGLLCTTSDASADASGVSMTLDVLT
jgi:hypothetical protein